MRTRPDRRIAPLLGALCVLSAPGAEAAKIGEPVLDLRIYGITDAPNVPGFTGPGEHGPLLDWATELDLEDGGVVRSAQIGSSSGGFPVVAEVGVANGGDTFWAFADTPNHYSNANRDYIGSEGVVRIYQSYTKDTEDASLTYTYTKASIYAFMSVEHGPKCQVDEEYCLRAGMVSLVEIFDAAGAAVGADATQAHVQSRIGASPWEHSTQDGLTPWPWEVDESGLGGQLTYTLSLSGPVTNHVDLEGVALGQEFTVVYTLWTYALDTSADAGLYRAAQAYARDPLGGDTGVSFEVTGLTPTNNPSVRPAPEPAALWLVGVGAATLYAVRRLARGAGLAGVPKWRPK